MHRITQKHGASQGENTPKNVPAGTFSEDFLQQVHFSAYEALTNPQKVVVIPRYFVQHWLPVLGPSRAWLALAFRQASFVARASGRQVIRPLSMRQLARWSQLSPGQISNILQDPGELEWFASRSVEPGQPEPTTGRGERFVWRIPTGLPICPNHLARLAAYFRQLNLNAGPHEETSQARTLKALLKALPSLLADPYTPAEPIPCKHLHQLVEHFLGPLRPAAAALCDEISARIVQPGSTLAISHYFIDLWASDLKSGEAWLVHVLRSLVYAGQQGSGQAFIEGGKTRLASMLGVDPRSMRRWFAVLRPGMDENGLAHFIRLDAQAGEAHDEDRTSADAPPGRIESNDQTRVLSLSIQLSDPIHPQDQAAYDALVADFCSHPDKIKHSTNHPSAGKSALLPSKGRTKLNTLDPAYPDKTEHSLDNPEQMSGQNQTDSLTKIDSLPDKINQPAGQNQTGERTKPNALMSLNNNPVKSQPRIPPQLTQAGVTAVVGGVGESAQWNLDGWLQTGGIGPEARQKALETVQNDPKMGDRLFAWLLYGYEHRSNAPESHAPAAKKGRIAMPAMFALSRYLHNQPEPVYLELAALGPPELLFFLANPYAPGLHANWRPVLDRLKRGGFSGLLKSVEGVGAQPEAVHPAPLEPGVSAGSLSSGGYPASVVAVETGEKNLPLALQLERVQSEALPKTAREYWAGIRRACGLKEDESILMSVLEGQRLVLTVTAEAVYTRLKVALEERLDLLRQRFPGGGVELRLLGAVGVRKDGWPQYGELLGCAVDFEGKN